MDQLKSILKENRYPGRGILLGYSADGQQAVALYFIMGRSENSRNRVFTEKDGGIITEAADPAKLKDPSLILYAPVRRYGPHTIITNGDQTDTIWDHMAKDMDFEDALRTRTFEPDSPNYTPRISGILSKDFHGLRYKLSILKSAEGDGRSVQRMFFEYPQPLRGQGHFIHTYAEDGDPLPSFAGEPRTVALEDSMTGRAALERFAQSVWGSLDEENKVSLFVRSIYLDGDAETVIINKYNKIIL